MADADRLLGMYLHLARASKMRQQPLVRAKLLVLAGVQAESMGLDEISALCRHRVLVQNPRHLVGRWPSIGEALDTERFQSHLRQLKRRYSSEKVEHMIDSLGIEMGNEREAYFSDSEYAAALLNTKVEAIPAIIAQDPFRQRREVNTSDGHSPAVERQEPPVDRVPLSPLGNLLVVWGPLAAGLVALGLLAAAFRMDR